MFSFNKKGGLLGIDISSSAVKLIELSHKGGTYRVDSYGVVKWAVLFTHGVGTVLGSAILCSLLKELSYRVSMVLVWLRMVFIRC